MTQYDAPDWQNIVTVAPPGAVSDSPDWQTVVTGPGGGVVPGASPDGWTTQFWGTGAWTFPPYVPTVPNTAFVNGRIYFTALPVSTTTTVSTISIVITTALTGPVANENYLGIYLDSVYDPSGDNYTLVGATAAGTCDTYFTGAGTMYNIPLASPVTLVAGQLYWIALLSTGSSNTLKVLVSSLGTPASGSGGIFRANQVGPYGTNLEPSVAYEWSGTETSLPNPFAPLDGLAGAQAIFAQVI